MFITRICVGLAVIATGAACGASSPTSSASLPSTTGGAGPASTGPTASGPVGQSQTPVPIESNPPGDIADNVAYVRYSNVSGRYSFLHPEGWATLTRGTKVTFTDKLNGITADIASAATAPTPASAQQESLALKAAVPAFELRSIRSISLPAGAGELIVFRRNSAPDAVTGKVYRDEVNRYEVFRDGRLVTLDLFGAVGSDNVDPYTKISRSLQLS